MNRYMMKVKGNTRFFNIPIVWEPGYYSEWIGLGFDVYPLFTRCEKYSHEITILQCGNLYGFGINESPDFLDELRNDGFAICDVETINWTGGSDATEKMKRRINEK